MTGVMGLYAQYLGAIPEDPYASAEEYGAAVRRAVRMLDEADAVVVGIGSGMSTSCGYDHYHRSDLFEGEGPLARFRRAHGYDTLMDGFYHLYASNEERWAYLAAYCSYMGHAPIGSAYLHLRELLKSRDYTVITTNVDGQVRRTFPAERSWLFQGDIGYLQCSQPCSDELVDAAPFVDRLVASLGAEGTAVAPEALPRCPHCGWLMAPWVRDDGFLEGEAWHEGKRCYEGFVERSLATSDNVLFMELGVGGMTPSVIELPFWRMVRSNPNARYLRINIGKAAEPRQLGDRSHTVTGDIARVLQGMVSWKSGRGTA